jgi:uncharacterized protein (DUF1015 family)
LFASVTEVLPLDALHYDLARVGSLGSVVAPPYDVIDDAMRAELVDRSAFNVVELDLPVAQNGGDPYEHAAAKLEAWAGEGILTADREPTVWALTQDYVGPDGVGRRRQALLARVRVTDYGAGEIRPHERTQPGPKEDRLRLTRATRHNLSPIFSLHPGDSWSAVEGAVGGDPWGEATDADGTVNRVWRITDPSVHTAVTEALDSAELLIADGHHRYETARVYADELGGDGPHRYTLMALTSLEDPGLTVFATHRLLKGLAQDSEKQERLAGVLRERFDVEEVPAESLDPAGEDGIGVFGYIDSHFRRGFRLRLKDPASLAADMPERSEAYRSLDAAILEKVILEGALGMTPEDVEAKRGIGYVSNPDGAVAALDGGYDAAFLLRPTPVDAVRAVAAAGETMPPKSTFFYPKLPTGIVFNPLS